MAFKKLDGILKKKTMSVLILYFKTDETQYNYLVVFSATVINALYALLLSIILKTLIKQINPPSSFLGVLTLFRTILKKDIALLIALYFVIHNVI